jgi:hypothetical protein
MKVQIQDTELRKRLNQLGAAVLPDVAPVVGQAASRVGTAALFGVPQGTGALAASAFHDGPEIDPDAKSVTATTGYSAEHAAYVHEGHHYGRKVKAPSKWLEQVSDQLDADEFAKQVARALWDSIAKQVK